MTAPNYDRPTSITRPGVTQAGPAAVPPTLVEIKEALRAEVRAALYPTLAEARRLINEAGVRTAQAKLGSALDILDLSQKELREAQAVERAAQEAFDQAVLDAEWQLDEHFVREANRTYLVRPCNEHKAGEGTEACTECGGTDEVRRQLTADEAKAWKSAEARKSPEVAAAKEALRRATDKALDARDAITLSEKRISACTHRLDASVGVLATLTAGLAAGLAAGDGRGA